MKLSDKLRRYANPAQERRYANPAQESMMQGHFIEAADKLDELEAQVAALKEDAKFVYDDLKMRSVDGVVPISHSAWMKVCRMAALMKESE